MIVKVFENKLLTIKNPVENKPGFNLNCYKVLFIFL